MRPTDGPTGSAAAAGESGDATKIVGRGEDAPGGPAAGGASPAAGGASPAGAGASPAGAGQAGSRPLRPAARRAVAAGIAAVAGSGFGTLTTAPTVLVIAWLLPGVPLLLAGVFLPVPMLLIAAPLVVALAVNGLRSVPGAWPRAIPGAGAVRPWHAWWAMAGTPAVAAGFALWQFLLRSQPVIVGRPPGAYLQAGYWIAQHGSLPIPQSLAAFGGAHPGLGFSSIGFFAVHSSVVPGVMSGLPILLAGGFWVHGLPAAAALGPILGGLAVLAFGGLVGRLAGTAWAPAGALVLAMTLPEQYTSRAAFSETVAQVLLFGGLSLVVDALTAGRQEGHAGAAGWLTPQRALAALGGLALGLVAVVAVDGLFDVLPAIPFLGILAVGRSRAATPFCLGLVVGAGYGVADGLLAARPFLVSLGDLPALAGVITAWLLALTVAAVQVMRSERARGWTRRVLARRPLRWLPGLAALVAVAALAALAVRPYLQTVRGQRSHAAAGFVAALQRLQGLPVDPGRLYAEDTLYWVIWYAGVPAVLLGGLGLALLIRRGIRALTTGVDRSGAGGNWGLPLAVVCWGAAAVLWQPRIDPDQPWASRRLVPLVLPGLILCAIWAAAWLGGRARERGASRVTGVVVGACCVAALLVPSVSTSFGVGLTHSGKAAGLRPAAAGLALRSTGQGEVEAVRRLCASLGPRASVVILDRRVAQRFTQTVRGMCGVPAAWMAGQPIASVDRVLAGIARAGRRPVLLAARRGQLAGYGGTPVRVLDLATTQDPHSLTQPPGGPLPLRYVIWMTAPAASGNGV